MWIINRILRLGATLPHTHRKFYIKTLFHSTSCNILHMHTAIHRHENKKAVKRCGAVLNEEHMTAARANIGLHVIVCNDWEKLQQEGIFFVSINVELHFIGLFDYVESTNAYSTNFHWQTLAYFPYQKPYYSTRVHPFLLYCLLFPEWAD